MLGLGPKSGLVPILQFIHLRTDPLSYTHTHSRSEPGRVKVSLRRLTTGLTTCFWQHRVKCNSSASFNRYEFNTISRIFHLFYPLPSDRSTKLNSSINLFYCKLCFSFIWFSCQGDKKNLSRTECGYRFFLNSKENHPWRTLPST